MYNVNYSEPQRGGFANASLNNYNDKYKSTSGGGNMGFLLEHPIVIVVGVILLALIIFMLSGYVKAPSDEPTPKS